MKKYIKFSIMLCIIVFGSLFFASYTYIKDVTSNLSETYKKDEVYTTYSYVDEKYKKDALKSTQFLCLKYEFTPEFMKSVATDIAIVKIISEDYMVPNESMIGMTYGKLLVNNVISGKVKAGEVLTYKKPGGYIDMATYNESRPKASMNKRIYLREQSGLENDMSNEYINILADSDIELETGRTYLAYLTLNVQDGAYEIIGFGNGLREVNIEKESNVSISNINIKESMIKNNNTNEWESLEKYVEENIK